MPRRPNPIPSKDIHIKLPENIAARVEIFLWSEVEGRVPQGAYQQFFSKLIQDFFTLREINLAPFVGVGEPTLVLSGTDEALQRIINHLKKGDSHEVL